MQRQTYSPRPSWLSHIVLSRVLCRVLAGALFAACSVCGPAVAGADPADSARDKGTKDDNQQVLVQDKPWLINSETRYKHTLPEVDGAMLTVTKKTSVVQLDDQPPVIDNNQREIFARLPGVFISEQQNPDQLNLSYRGIGNPQESEFVMVMQDGIPLLSDWIGFPTLYYIPVPQSVSSVQLIRGGSGLLYGPEPQPVINFISRQPDPDHKLTGFTEQVGGSDALYSTYNQLSGTSGAWNYLLSYHHRQSDGRRKNGDYDLDSSDLHVGYRFDADHKLSFDFHGYAVNSGDAGRMSYTQWVADPDLTVAPNNHTWLNRYTGVLTYEGTIGEKGLLISKLWSGYEDLDQRTSPNIVPPAQPTSSTLSIERFHYTGLDTRYRLRWSRANAFTFGVTGYRSTAPWLRYNYAGAGNIAVGRNQRTGTVGLDQDRETTYGAFFAENVFRFHRFHVVPSFRYEYEKLDVNEHVVPTARPLLDRAYRKDLPLFGLGFGNDFGRGNETYVNISQGFRPLRYLDVASPFGNTNVALNNPDPTKSISYEAGVHGWPKRGFYYDISLFQVDVKDRIESQAVTSTPDPTDAINVNTGDTRSRGLEVEVHYDLMTLLEPQATNKHLEIYGNLSLLDAEFTSSSRGLAGSEPAFAPDYIGRLGVNWRQDDLFKVALNMQAVDSSFWQDSNLPFGTPGGLTYLPAKTPSYVVFDLSGEFKVGSNVRLTGGVANITDRQYYARVFSNTLEPASGRTFFAGFRLEL